MEPSQMDSLVLTARKTDATSALITAFQSAPRRKHMEPLQMNRCNQCTYNKLLPLGNAWILQKADGSIKSIKLKVKQMQPVHLSKCSP